jgi:hypothetical protein
MPIKSLTWAPLSGVLDNRSNPGNMPPQSWRRALNVWVPAKNRLARRFGWENLFSSESDYNNQDLHDQLLSLQTYYDTVDQSVDQSTILSLPNAACGVVKKLRDIGRQPITMLRSFRSTFESRTLLAATESRIYALNEHTGNWRLIADGKGQGLDDGTCPRRRFYCSVNLDTAIFTNDYDKPLYWIYGSPVTGCDQQAARPIPDLDVIGVTKAAVTWTWKNVTFLADLEVDGVRRPYRVVWSDYGDPISFDPAKASSIAGQQDLDYGEKILGAMELADAMYIFTTKRIWQLGLRSDGAFTFTHRFTPEKSGAACLFYRNTLVASETEIYYFGKDGLYSFSQYRPTPTRIEIGHLATAKIFNESAFGTISTEWCDNHVAGYNPLTKEILFSWVPRNSETGLPESTFVFNAAFPHCSEIDHGFTAFCTHQSYTDGTLRDYLIDICACTAAELNAAGSGFVKEGLPLSLEPSECPEYDSLYTTVGVVVDGVELEDKDQAAPSANAICQSLAKPEDICGGCEAGDTFIGACAVDWCLKQFTSVYSRERCTNPTATGTTGDDGYTSSVGVYALDGYETLLISLAMNFQDQRNSKTLHRFELEGIPEEQVTPSQLYFSLGMSHQVVDPLNDRRCGITWDTQEVLLLECQSDSVATNAANGTRPDLTFEWPLYYTSLYFYFKISISGTGGGFDMSKLAVDVENTVKDVPVGW